MVFERRASSNEDSPVVRARLIRAHAQHRRADAILTGSTTGSFLSATAQLRAAEQCYL